MTILQTLNNNKRALPDLNAGKYFITTQTSDMKLLKKYTKLKSRLCLPKDITDRVTKHMTYWQKIFATFLNAKGPVSRSRIIKNTYKLVRKR